MAHILTARLPKPTLRKLAYMLFVLMPAASLHAQLCNYRITAPSGGIDAFPCTDVTVTSENNTLYGMSTPCSVGPYGMDSGSWTFAFSEPVAGVTLEFVAFDYNIPIGGGPHVYDAAALEINGVPVPFQSVGAPLGCSMSQVPTINGLGELQAHPNTHGACRDLHIFGSISSIKVTNIQYNGYAAGIGMGISFCCPPCLTKAGLIPASPLNLCPDVVANVPPAAPNVLPQGTMLQYILFSNQDDTLGSIIMIQNSPSFAFDPAIMQEGVTYFIAAIAGRELNGNVDLSDRCLDISDNAIPVTWHPRPTVAFTSDNPDVCKGTCFEVRLEFSGEPPFILTYINSNTGIQTKTYGTHNDIIQVCTSPSTPHDGLLIQALKLVDQYCVCE